MLGQERVGGDRQEDDPDRRRRRRSRIRRRSRRLAPGPRPDRAPVPGAVMRRVRPIPSRRTRQAAGPTVRVKRSTVSVESGSGADGRSLDVERACTRWPRRRSSPSRARGRLTVTLRAEACVAHPARLEVAEQQVDRAATPPARYGHRFMGGHRGDRDAARVGRSRVERPRSLDVRRRRPDLGVRDRAGCRGRQGRAAASGRTAPGPRGAAYPRES